MAICKVLARTLQIALDVMKYYWLEYINAVLRVLQLPWLASSPGPSPLRGGGAWE